MKYFTAVENRKGSMYYEFFKGKWDGKTFWKNDSICVHDDVWYGLEIDLIIISAIPKYAPFGETEVIETQWNTVLEAAKEKGGETYAAILEADVWVKENFKEHKVFTILGL